MDLRATLTRIKSVAGTAAVLGTVGAWLVVFQSGWHSGEWAGFWSSPTDVRGDAVSIAGRRVETPLEREKRLGITGDHVNDTLYEAKKKVLGERAKTRGDDIRAQRGYVPEMYRYTERETCMQMQLEFPERYKNVDCMSADMTDEPWLPGAPPRDDDAKDGDKDKPRAAPSDDPMGSPRLPRSPLVTGYRPELRAEEPADTPDPDDPALADPALADPDLGPDPGAEPQDPFLIQRRALGPPDPADDPDRAP